MDRNPSWFALKISLSSSLSARRAWIEMVYLALIRYLINTSLSARRAWIEILLLRVLPFSVASLSARRAWIEICFFWR